MTADTSDGGETKRVSVHISFPSGDLTDGPGGAKETCQPVGRAGDTNQRRHRLRLLPHGSFQIPSEERNSSPPRLKMPFVLDALRCEALLLHLRVLVVCLWTSRHSRLSVAVDLHPSLTSQSVSCELLGNSTSSVLKAWTSRASHSERIRDSHTARRRLCAQTSSVNSATRHRLWRWRNVGAVLIVALLPSQVCLQVRWRHEVFFAGGRTLWFGSWNIQKINFSICCGSSSSVALYLGEKRRKLCLVLLSKRVSTLREGVGIHSISFLTDWSKVVTVSFCLGDNLTWFGCL